MPRSERPFRDYADLLARLEARGLFHMELGLGRMRRALSALDFDFGGATVIQTLGTNGKGSVCAFLTALSLASGQRTGTYLSPHFLSPRERILIDGRPLSREAWLKAANEILAAYPSAIDLTYFEFLTLLALWLFREAGAQSYILEAGLGGKNDATSCVKASARCFAPVGMDHAGIIGPGIGDIAADKAAVIGRGSANFSTAQYPLVARALRAAAKGARLEFVEPLDPRPLGLRGSHQLANAALALRCWREFFPDCDGEALRAAFLPGRMQFMHDSDGEYVLDGAHNPPAIQNLIRRLDEEGAVPEAIIYATMADKDWKTSLGQLIGAYPRARMFFARLPGGRAADPEELAAFHRARLPSGECLAGRLAERPRAQGLTLATGSLYLLSEFYALRPRYLYQFNCED